MSHGDLGLAYMKTDFFGIAVTASQYLQIFIIPALVTIIGFCGIAVASASQVLYGSVIWDPLKIIDHWNSRPASFFASFSLALAGQCVTHW